MLHPLHSSLLSVFKFPPAVVCVVAPRLVQGWHSAAGCESPVAAVSSPLCGGAVDSGFPLPALLERGMPYVRRFVVTSSSRNDFSTAQHAGKEVRTRGVGMYPGVRTCSERPLNALRATQGALCQRSCNPVVPCQVPPAVAPQGAGPYPWQGWYGTQLWRGAGSLWIHAVLCSPLLHSTVPLVFHAARVAL